MINLDADPRLMDLCPPYIYYIYMVLTADYVKVHFYGASCQMFNVALFEFLQVIDVGLRWIVFGLCKTVADSGTAIAHCPRHIEPRVWHLLPQIYLVFRMDLMGNEIGGHFSRGSENARIVCVVNTELPVVAVQIGIGNTSVLKAESVEIRNTFRSLIDCHGVTPR